MITPKILEINMLPSQSEQFSGVENTISPSMNFLFLESLHEVHSRNV